MPTTKGGDEYQVLPDASAIRLPGGTPWAVLLSHADLITMLGEVYESSVRLRREWMVPEWNEALSLYGLELRES